jgi:hypothetical protein
MEFLRQDDTTAVAAYFNEQLTEIETQVYETETVFNRTSFLLPVNVTGNAFADTYKYRVLERVGSAAYIANGSMDYPAVDLHMKEYPTKIRKIGNKFTMSLDDIKVAQAQGRDLESDKALAAKEAMDVKIDYIAWMGDPERGVPGLINHPNITQVLPSDDGVGGSTEFGDKTPTQVLNDILRLIAAPSNVTKGSEFVDSLLLPNSVVQTLLTLGVGTTEKSVLEILEQKLNLMLRTMGTRKGVTPTPVNIGVLSYLDDIDGNGTRAMIAYSKNMNKISFHLPIPFEREAEHYKGPVIDVFYHARVGSIVLKRPLSVAIMEGI